ncbi:hypothetical protein, partial [Dysgonomonas sp. 511]|uniref:hypothetical protein n=1 Tax=Dysgonomonas sp. 511 TaxID=2302930 RepID=UPI001626B536
HYGSPYITVFAPLFEFSKENIYGSDTDVVYIPGRFNLFRFPAKASALSHSAANIWKGFSNSKFRK